MGISLQPPQEGSKDFKARQQYVAQLDALGIRPLVFRVVTDDDTPIADATLSEPVASPIALTSALPNGIVQHATRVQAEARATLSLGASTPRVSPSARPQRSVSFGPTPAMAVRPVDAAAPHSPVKPRFSGL